MEEVVRSQSKTEEVPRLRSRRVAIVILGSGSENIDARGAIVGGRARRNPVQERGPLTSAIQADGRLLIGR